LARIVHERADIVPLVAEIFRELGYEGATFSRITERTGLGKGSLYHFFPGGKEEMASAILAEVESWFERFVYEPLRRDDPAQGIATMWRAVDEYFRSGGRVCLVGAFALSATRDQFALAIGQYFSRWIEALTEALVRSGRDPDLAAPDAEEVVLGIQGALVLARALDDTLVFSRALDRLRRRLEGPQRPA
jgi:TetR/AcrR family transcriptional regulator, lmrAB and yxaGH operons repressor